MATKFETKLVITWFVLEISARFLRWYGSFRGWAIECCQMHFRRPNLGQNRL